MTNTMTCAVKREAWSRYLPSHLAVAKILCSRCEPCTEIICRILARMLGKRSSVQYGDKTYNV